MSEQRLDLPEHAGSIPNVNVDKMSLVNARWDKLLMCPIMWVRQANGELCCYPIPLGLLFAEALRAQASEDALRTELETERMRLAGCGVAAMANTAETVAQRIQPGHPYYSASYGDVCSAVDREMALRERVKQYQDQYGECRRMDSTDEALAKMTTRAIEAEERVRVLEDKLEFHGIPMPRGVGKETT